MESIILASIFFMVLQSDCMMRNKLLIYLMILNFMGHSIRILHLKYALIKSKLYFRMDPIARIIHSIQKSLYAIALLEKFILHLQINIHSVFIVIIHSIHLTLKVAMSAQKEPNALVVIIFKQREVIGESFIILQLNFLKILF